MSNAPHPPRGPDAALMSLIGSLTGDVTNRRLAILLVALVAVFGLIIGEGFFTKATVQSMAFQLPELGILSLAMMITLISGGLNLSIISTANLCALAMAYIMTKMLPGTEGFAFVGWQIVAIAVGLLIASIIGLVNGFIIAYLGVSPILTTLGTMTMVKGIGIGMTRGNVISGLPDSIVFLGNGTVVGIPTAMLVFAVVAIPMAIALGRTPFGAATYMIGSNEKATQFSGIDTKRVILRIYVISSVLAAVAGLVMMARFNSANASYAESYLLVTILAAVLGGVDPMGGFGKIAGVILSLVILQVISSAFNLLNFSQFLTLAIWGAILVGVTAVPNIRKRLGLID
jgi:simple sugar transport system permease protein